jgi:hypothetical protein
MKNNPRARLILYETRLAPLFRRNRMADYATFPTKIMINRANLDSEGSVRRQMIESAAPIVGHYGLRLGGLSVLVAILAAYAVLDLAGRIMFARGTEGLCG